MNVICNDEDITIRLIEKDSDDIEAIYKWLNQDSVSKYYGDSREKDLSYVREKYFNKIADSNMYPCIIEYNHNKIGYIQFYKTNYTEYDIPEDKYLKIATPTDNVIAIDLFIGNDEYRDKGVGTRILKSLINTLFKEYKADVLLIDPKTNNPRAIACYKKAGFNECFIIEQREEINGTKYDNLIMKIDKQEYIGDSTNEE